MTRTRDMTAGSPTGHLLRFFLPVMAGNACQQLYSLVDSFIIGNVESVTEMTAVSASSWLDMLALCIAVGLTQGIGVRLSQLFGAGDVPRLKKAVGQSLLLSLFTVAVMEALAQLFLWPLLLLLNTPADIIHLTCLYLRIVFAGMGLVMGFNLFSNFLRAVGNSTIPLMAMIAAACTNIVLDLVFVAGLRMGVAGVAVATVIGQGVSCLICLLAVLRTPVLRISREDLRFDGRLCWSLVRLGLPISFQGAGIALGNMVLQRVVNGFSFVFVAGYNATGRMTSLIQMAGISLESAASTFAGQNLGAERLDRVRLGLRRACQIAVTMSLIVATLLVLFGRNLLSLFIHAEDPAIVQGALTYAFRYMLVMCAGLPLTHLLFAYRGTLQGLGDTVMPMCSGFMELGVRIVGVLLLPPLLDVAGIFAAEYLAWIGALTLLICAYYRCIRRLESRRAPRMDA